jgi:hypothetical protein
MLRDPFVAFASPGRLHLSLRTAAANDNAPLDATAPPRRADGGASTRWPILSRLRVEDANTSAAAANERAGRPVRKTYAWL